MASVGSLEVRSRAFVSSTNQAITHWCCRRLPPWPKSQCRAGRVSALRTALCAGEPRPGLTPRYGAPSLQLNIFLSRMLVQPGMDWIPALGGALFY